MGSGRPKKRSRNISGLRNQPGASKTKPVHATPIPEDSQDETSELETSDSAADAHLNLVHDSLKPRFDADDAGSGSDLDEESDWEELEDEEMLTKMVKLIEVLEGKAEDAEWIPAELMRAREKAEAMKRRM